MGTELNLTTADSDINEMNNEQNELTRCQQHGLIRNVRFDTNVSFYVLINVLFILINFFVKIVSIAYEYSLNF